MPCATLVLSACAAGAGAVTAVAAAVTKRHRCCCCHRLCCCCCSSGSLKRGRGSESRDGSPPAAAAGQGDVKMEDGQPQEEGGPAASKQQKLEDGSASPSHTGPSPSAPSAAVPPADDFVLSGDMGSIILNFLAKMAFLVGEWPVAVLVGVSVCLCVGLSAFVWGAWHMPSHCLSTCAVTRCSCSSDD